MFILDTDHISLFQRRDVAVSARVFLEPRTPARLASRHANAEAAYSLNSE